MSARSLRVLDGPVFLPPVQPFRVALIGMPFGVEVNAPSIQLGLLRAIAERAGFPTDTYHLSLDLAQRMTPRLYDAMCLHRGHMTAEWLFAVAAFREDAPSSVESYLEAFPEERDWLESLGKDASYLAELRQEILPRFIEECLQGVRWEQYRVVGFSSTFQQQVASLALARRIKERHPEITIVFGGANLEGDMGVEQVRAFPFIDYSVIGEGDEVFPALLCCLAAGAAPTELPGLAGRAGTGAGVCFSGQAAPVHNLDALPTPNYDEYFARARQLGIFRDGQRLASLPFESSRGCWWGAKHHCTFCGLNAHGMGFRAKSPQRVLEELDELAGKYRISAFQATDNIFDMKFIKDMFSAIQEQKTDYQFFYEVKANLTREQLRTLHRGGVRRIQPGIESLSTHVLKLMRKGCTMLQNVRLLKWCRYYGIIAYWNLLWGFPGETDEDYRQEYAVLKCLSHLQPPTSASRIWLERFAPYFTQRNQFPVHKLCPESSYRHVYPSYVDLEKVAYFFDYAMGETAAEAIHQPTKEWVEEWRRRWFSEHPDTLSYRRLRDLLFIDEHRGTSANRMHTLRGIWAEVYDSCSETMRTVPQIAEHVQAETGGLGPSEWELSAGLEGFCEKGLMLEEDGHYLSLALPVNPNW